MLSGKKRYPQPHNIGRSIGANVAPDIANRIHHAAKMGGPVERFVPYIEDQHVPGLSECRILRVLGNYPHDGALAFHVESGDSDAYLYMEGGMDMLSGTIRVSGRRSPSGILTRLGREVGPKPGSSLTMEIFPDITVLENLWWTTVPSGCGIEEFADKNSFPVSQGNYHGKMASGIAENPEYINPRLVGALANTEVRYMNPFRVPVATSDVLILNGDVMTVEVKCSENGNGGSVSRIIDKRRNVAKRQLRGASRVIYNSFGEVPCPVGIYCHKGVLYIDNFRYDPDSGIIEILDTSEMKNPFY